MRQTMLWLAGLSFWSFAAHSTTDDVDELMHILAARSNGQVSFVEQHFSSLLKRPTESSGELLYHAPNRLEKRTLEPHPEDLILEHDAMTLRRSGRTRVLDLDTFPQIQPLVESIRATLAGDRSALERIFHLVYTGELARWTLTLTPLDAQAAKVVAQVQIDGAGDNLLRVEMRQTDGDRTLMTLRARSAP